MPNSPTAPYGALLLRLTLGVMFLAHGLLKVFVFTLPGTVKFFAMLGYPAALAYVVVALEIFGGLMLLAGVYTRAISIVLVPVLVGALLVHLPNGWVFSATNGGWEFPALWIALLFVQVLLGPGAFALRLPVVGGGSREPTKA
jgi:putative oxidoreductase